MDKLKYIKPETCIINCGTDCNILQSSHNDDTTAPKIEDSGKELGAKGSNVFFEEDNTTSESQTIWNK